MTAKAVEELEAPATSDAQPFLPDYLLFLTASVSAAMSEEFHEHVRTRGLRVPEWRVLACLHDDDGQMITRLARFAMIEQSRLTRIIDNMDERGLLERRSDKADRRRVRIFLTRAGARLAADLVSEARAHEKRLIKRLPDGLGQDLKATVKRLHGVLWDGEQD